MPASTPSIDTTVAILGDGGLARSLAARLLADGFSVRLSGRNPEAPDEAIEKLETPIETVDASDFSAVEDFLERANEDDSLAAVVNCAGSLLLKPAHLTTSDDYAETISSNLTTAFATVRATARVLGRKGGSVVLISSAAAKYGLPNHEVIAAAKAGVEGLVRSAAATYASRGLRFNAVAPGLVESPMTERITSNDKAFEASRAMHALGRAGTPDDVSSIVAWLVSDHSSWVTGQVWGVDGGLSSVKAR